MADLYDLGQRPPLGEVPKQMHAYAVRQNRFGAPKDAWKREVLPTPGFGPDEVLIYVWNQRGRQQFAARRIQWTPGGGYTLLVISE